MSNISHFCSCRDKKLVHEILYNLSICVCDIHAVSHIMTEDFGEMKRYDKMILLCLLE